MDVDGKHTNMIYLLLVKTRWKTAVRVCRTYQGADISSDHSFGDVQTETDMCLKKHTKTTATRTTKEH